MKLTMAQGSNNKFVNLHDNVMYNYLSDNLRGCGLTILVKSTICILNIPTDRNELTG